MLGADASFLLTPWPNIQCGEGRNAKRRRNLAKKIRASGNRWWKRLGGTLGLMVGAVGLGALIFFLLRRSRGDDVRESVERVSETVRSGAEEYVGSSSREAEPREAGESPAGQGGATAEGDARDVYKP
jgi:hypothetical protein